MSQRELVEVDQMLRTGTSDLQGHPQAAGAELVRFGPRTDCRYHPKPGARQLSQSLR